MADIIPFPSKEKKDIKGIPETPPRTSREFLEILKKHLKAFDYELILCAIMDESYYKALPPEYQTIVNWYMIIEDMECSET